MGPEYVKWSALCFYYTMALGCQDVIKVSSAVCISQ